MSAEAHEFTYTVGGLAVSSEFPLPELAPCELSNPSDVRIIRDTVPESIPDGVQVMFEAWVTPGLVLLDIPSVGRILAVEGREIRVDPAPDVRPEDLRLFILGSAFGAIYLQRGLFPLHASVIVVRGQAVAFAGDPGTGKSTLAAWMNAQGYPVLTDDVCVIRLDGDRGPIACPSFPRIKLWKDTLAELGLNRMGLQRDLSRADKYHLSPIGEFETGPVPLQQINFLSFCEDGSAPELERIPPARAVSLLRDNTYRYQFVSAMGLTEHHFRACTRIGASVAMHRLRRPKRFSALAECQRLIEESVK